MFLFFSFYNYIDMFYQIICFFKYQKFCQGMKIINLFCFVFTIVLIIVYSKFLREPQGIRACCNPVPQLVQHNLHDIHQIIIQVRDIPLIEVRLFVF